MNLVQPFSRFSDFDIDLFKTGKHYHIYEKMGAFPMNFNAQEGVYFAVWAPSAKAVSVVGNFNAWKGEHHKLFPRWDSSGIWEGFIPGIQSGELYKYKIHSKHQDIITLKADPYGRFCETPPQTASVVWQDDYAWQDAYWMSHRYKKNAHESPMSIYEVHLGSWRRHMQEDRFLTYRELAVELVDYVKDMGFTHLELMPVMEYPFDPSWGYQITGFYAPTSRFGTPEDFKFLIDKCHRAGIGVILDWVPSHFPEDAHGLARFDGTHVYEHPDYKKGYHPDWKSLIFNYERPEVISFLISNAIYWLKEYHIDGLRVDAVSSVLFLDYSREEGEWEPNEYGGRENLAAMDFVRELNTAVYKEFPDVQTIAEESTDYPGITKPVFMHGLGFGMKWMMGWMHDTLDFFKREPVYRQSHYYDICFSIAYAFSENFVLPLSHDEVVHGKSALIGKMPGDEWQKFANLRLLYAYMYAHPGTKLLFMGSEIGQYNEWNFATNLEWDLLQYDVHAGLQATVRALNKVYKKYAPFYAKQFSDEGFEWITYNDVDNTVIVFIRKAKSWRNMIIVACNFTPNVIENYSIGLPLQGKLEEVFNSDAVEFAGSGVHNKKLIKISDKPFQDKPYSAEITLPPLGAVYFKVKRH